MVRSAQKLLYPILLLILAVSILPVEIFAASDESDWFKKEPVLTKYADLPNGTPPPYSINENRDCVKRSVLTRPARVMNVWPYYSTEQSHESCVVDTRFGGISQSGYLQAPGENTFGKVYFPWGATMTLLPVPKSENAIYLIPNFPSGVRPVLIKDFLQHIEGRTLPTGEIEYTVRAGTPITELVTPNGQKPSIQISSVSFSANGRWMVADIPYVGTSRIDTTTFQIQTFDTAQYNLDIGVDPALKTAITSNGRYVVVSSTSFTRARLYDLTGCESHGVCNQKDLWKYFKDTVPGFIGFSTWRFRTDYSLKFYLVHQPAGKPRAVTSSTLRAFGHPEASFGYLGMGDSFASGEGAHSYKSLTDTTDNKCHISFRSYPYLIANELGLNQAESIACSGAVINDVSDRDLIYPDKSQAKGKNDPLFDVEIFKGFLPGYRPQLEFLEHTQPAVITLSAVGNDIGFGDKLRACVMPGTCYDDYESRLEVALEVNAQFDRLVSLYKDINGVMDNKKVYVIGYPEIAKNDGDCGVNVRLDSTEVKFSNQLVRHLNQMIKSAASKAGFFYVDVERAFHGSRLCEAAPDNTAVNGLTGGNDTRVFGYELDRSIGNESFHPNELGHQKFKEVILEQTSSFTKAMPSPDTSAKPPAITDDMELLKDMPKSGDIIRALKYKKGLLSSSDVFRNAAIEGTITLTESGFRPSSSVEVWMHSSPVKLGDFITDSKGNLSFVAKIPADTPYGFHTIHVYGTGISGGLIDIQEVIQVISEPEQEAHVDNSSPKPPENNPETVAGDEQILVALSDEQSVSENTGPEPLYNQGPYQVPDQQKSEEKPQVAGVNTHSVPQTQAAIETPGQEKTGWLAVLSPVSFLTATALLIGGRLLNKR